MPTYLFRIPADTAHFKYFFMLGEYFTICVFHNLFNHSSMIDIWVASKWASLVAQIVKNPPAMQETWVQSLGWEDLLEKAKVPTPVFWPGEFHGLYSPWGCKGSDTSERHLFSLNKVYTQITPHRGCEKWQHDCQVLLPVTGPVLFILLRVPQAPRERGGTLGV